MSVKKARKLRDGLLISGFVVALAGYLWSALSFVGVVLMFTALIPHFLWNKCPHCGKNFGRDGGDYCQYCGKSVE